MGYVITAVLKYFHFFRLLINRLVYQSLWQCTGCFIGCKDETAPTIFNIDLFDIVQILTK